jgi:hypothetical protein
VGTCEGCCLGRDRGIFEGEGDCRVLEVVDITPVDTGGEIEGVD